MRKPIDITRVTRTRGGAVVTGLSISALGGDYPVHGIADNIPRTWTVRGENYLYETPKESPLDLIEDPPVCPVCNSSRNMIDHDGDWQCHSTHPRDDSKTPRTDAAWEAYQINGLAFTLRERSGEIECDLNEMRQDLFTALQWIEDSPAEDSRGMDIVVNTLRAKYGDGTRKADTESR